MKKVHIKYRLSEEEIHCLQAMLCSCACKLFPSFPVPERKLPANKYACMNYRLEPKDQMRE